MRNRINFRILTSIALSGLLLALVLLPAVAQSSGTLSVAQPDLSAWPQISTTFSAIDYNGGFVADLQPGELRVVENEVTIPRYTLEMERVGVRFFVAINEGPTLDNKFSGVMRIDRLKTALFNWFASQPSDSSNEFYMNVNQGPLRMTADNPTSWKNALEGYLPDLSKATPGMASLSAAVDSALSSNLKDPKASALLFITPLPTDSQMAGLQEIVSRATSNGIRVFIWLIGPTDYATHKTAISLETLAKESGGSFFLFSGSEELPVIADLLEPLEYVYHLSYQSPANISGEYALVLSVTRGEIALTSEPVTYTLNVAPPNPIFLSPPSGVERTWTETKKKADSVLTPNSVPLEIMVEFPDGMKREIASSSLFVDGKLVHENTSAPFDTFNWDVSAITETGVHQLQVTLEDSAALQGKTISLPVTVNVAEKTFTTADRILEQFTLVNTIVTIVILLIIVSGLVLLIRYLRGRLLKKNGKNATDPVTQPVEIVGDYNLAPHRAEEVVKWPVIRGVGMAPARLLRKSSAAPNLEYQQEIPLGNDETLIGADRKKADVILTHPSISGLHARIFKDADGNYRIADSGSASGTWVNYAPVSTRGAALIHGDLVQFGRLAYVFEMHGAASKRVQVLPFKED